MLEFMLEIRLFIWTAIFETDIIRWIISLYKQLDYFQIFRDVPFVLLVGFKLRGFLMVEFWLKED